MVMCAVVRCQVIKACKTDSEGKVVEGKHHVYRMSAAQPDDKDDWIKCIKSVLCKRLQFFYQ